MRVVFPEPMSPSTIILNLSAPERIALCLTLPMGIEDEDFISGEGIEWFWEDGAGGYFSFG